jgi:hypothetical protein
VSSAVLDLAAGDRLFDETGAEPRTELGGLTLEERLNVTWHALRGSGVAECPVCQSRLRYDKDHGECEGCGSRLA